MIATVLIVIGLLLEGYNVLLIRLKKSSIGLLAPLVSGAGVIAAPLQVTGKSAAVTVLVAVHCLIFYWGYKMNSVRK